MKQFYMPISSPIGALTLVANERALIAVLWENDLRYPKKLKAAELSPTHAILRQAEKQLGEYFRGRRTVFELPLEFQGTEFQNLVWEQLEKIPYGCTASYGELATKVRRPKASRAVGAANGQNLLSIIVPCHRVIGANGKLTGFAGGLGAKSFLLNLEGSSYRS